MSLWEQYFAKKPIDGAIHYGDSLAQWSGAGNNELRQVIAEALSSQRRIRAVIANTKQTAAADCGLEGKSASKR